MICLFVLTEFTNVTDTQTDTQTPHDDIASRGKNGRKQGIVKQLVKGQGHTIPTIDWRSGRVIVLEFLGRAAFLVDV